MFFHSLSNKTCGKYSAPGSGGFKPKKNVFQEKQEIEMTDAMRKLVIRRFCGRQIHVGSDNAGFYKSLLDKLDLDALLEKEESKYWMDFTSWIFGLGQEYHHRKTPWGRTPLQHKEFKDFIDAFISAKTELKFRFEQLKLKGPQNMQEALIYFNHIINGDGTSDSIDDLSDLDYLIYGRGVPPPSQPPPPPSQPPSGQFRPPPSAPPPPPPSAPPSSPPQDLPSPPREPLLPPSSFLVDSPPQTFVPGVDIEVDPTGDFQEEMETPSEPQSPPPSEPPGPPPSDQPPPPPPPAGASLVEIESKIKEETDKFQRYVTELKSENLSLTDEMAKLKSFAQQKMESLETEKKESLTREKSQIQQIQDLLQNNKINKEEYESKVNEMYEKYENMYTANLAEKRSLHAEYAKTIEDITKSQKKGDDEGKGAIAVMEKEYKAREEGMQKEYITKLTEKEENIREETKREKESTLKEMESHYRNLLTAEVEKVHAILKEEKEETNRKSQTIDELRKILTDEQNTNKDVIEKMKVEMLNYARDADTLRIQIKEQDKLIKQIESSREESHKDVTRLVNESKGNIALYNAHLKEREEKLRVTKDELSRINENFTKMTDFVREISTYLSINPYETNNGQLKNFYEIKDKISKSIENTAKENKTLTETVFNLELKLKEMENQQRRLQYEGIKKSEDLDKLETSLQSVKAEGTALVSIFEETKKSQQDMINKFFAQQQEEQQKVAERMQTMRNYYDSQQKLMTKELEERKYEAKSNKEMFKKLLEFQKYEQEKNDKILAEKLSEEKWEEGKTKSFENHYSEVLQDLSSVISSIEGWKTEFQGSDEEKKYVEIVSESGKKRVDDLYNVMIKTYDQDPNAGTKYVKIALDTIKNNFYDQMRQLDSRTLSPAYVQFFERTMKDVMMKQATSSGKRVTERGESRLVPKYQDKRRKLASGYKTTIKTRQETKKSKTKPIKLISEID